MVTANFNSINQPESTSAPIVGVSQNRRHAWTTTDSDGSVKNGLVSVFASASSLQLILPSLSQQRVQVCDTWGQAVEESLAGHGGCILLEIDTDGQHKLDLLRQSRCQWDLLSVVACSVQDNGTMAMAAATAGCQEFVSLASCDTSDRNRQACDARDQIQRTIQQACHQDMSGEYCRQEFRANWKTLTLRERDVLRRCLDGDNSKSLAKQLTVTYQTIDKHRNRALRKMNCNSLIEFATLLYQLQSITD